MGTMALLNLAMSGREMAVRGIMELEMLMRR